MNADIRQALEEFTKWVSQVYPVSGVYLFGSQARGDNQLESDVDVAVLLPDPFSQSEWGRPQDFSNPDLLDNIRRDGVAF